MAASYRYALPAALLLAAALVPTIANRYRSPRVELRDTGFAPDAVLGVALEETGRTAKLRGHFDTPSFTERKGHMRDGREVTVVAASGMRAVPFFHFPERSLIRTGWTVRKVETKPLRYGGRELLSTHLTLSDSTKDKVWHAQSVLLYEGRSVTRPILFHLGVLPRWLVGNRSAFTFVFVWCPEQGSRERALEVIERGVRDTLAAMGVP